MLRISVSDTGKGISDKEKEHVFERFYQYGLKAARRAPQFSKR